MNNPMIQLSFERTQIPNTFLEQMNVNKLSVYPLINGFITYEVLFSDFYGCLFNDFVREDHHIDGVIYNIRYWLNDFEVNPFENGELKITKEEAMDEVRLTYTNHLKSGEKRILRIIFTKNCLTEIVNAVDEMLDELLSIKERALVVA